MDAARFDLADVCEQRGEQLVAASHETLRVREKLVVGETIETVERRRFVEHAITLHPDFRRSAFASGCVFEAICARLGVRASKAHVSATWWHYARFEARVLDRALAIGRLAVNSKVHDFDDFTRRNWKIEAFEARLARRKNLRRAGTTAQTRLSTGQAESSIRVNASTRIAVYCWVQAEPPRRCLSLRQLSRPRENCFSS
jgi:hypothetical protein